MISRNEQNQTFFTDTSGIHNLGHCVVLFSALCVYSTLSVILSSIRQRSFVIYPTLIRFNFPSNSLITTHLTLNPLSAPFPQHNPITFSHASAQTAPPPHQNTPPPLPRSHHPYRHLHPHTPLPPAQPHPHLHPHTPSPLHPHPHHRDIHTPPPHQPPPHTPGPAPAARHSRRQTGPQLWASAEWRSCNPGRSGVGRGLLLPWGGLPGAETVVVVVVVVCCHCQRCWRGGVGGQRGWETRGFRGRWAGVERQGRALDQGLRGGVLEAGRVVSEPRGAKAGKCFWVYIEVRIVAGSISAGAGWCYGGRWVRTCSRLGNGGVVGGNCT